MSLPSGKELFYKKLLRRSFWALALSGMCNVFAFTYIAIELDDGGFYTPAPQQKSVMLPFEGPKLLTVHDELVSTRGLSFDALCALLYDVTPVGDGYAKRDIALSALVSRYHFTLDRALQMSALQKRTVKVGDEHFHLFPGLTNEQFDRVQAFIDREEWPFSFQGLRQRLKENGDAVSLKLACMQTKEYQEIERIFTHEGKISKEDAYLLIVCADEPALFALKQKPSFEGRLSFLQKLLPEFPQVVAPIFARMDVRYAIHALDDEKALLMLKALEGHPALCREYALGLLVSPRSDAVWKEALIDVCQLAKLDPEKETRTSVLQRLGLLKAKAPAPIKKVEVPAAVKKVVPAKKTVSERVHVVKSGDNLWALSKKYKVSVDAIKKRNNLQGDALKPGTVLKIPNV